MKYITLAICFVLSVFVGCTSKSSSESPPVYANNLAGDAYKTYLLYEKAIRAGTENSNEEIPPAYWADRIKSLSPVKVYTHRCNIVVVQSHNNGIEEGKYIYIPISSYLPQTGDDGFVFSPNPTSGGTHAMGKDVYDFTRSM